MSTSSTLALNDFRDTAGRVVRNIPQAHHVIESWWRKRQFRSALLGFVDDLYQIESDELGDDDLEAIEQLARMVLNAAEMSLASLRVWESDRDVQDREYLTQVCQRLRVALDGLEAGLPPNPELRPKDEELLDRLGVILDRTPSLSRHKPHARAGIA